MAWVKPFHAFKKGVSPAYAWEPIILRGGRRRQQPPYDTPKDFLSTNITLRKQLVGAKPAAFCFWLFDCLNAQPGDQLDDLFPGTGIVGHCWNVRMAEMAEDREALERQGVLL